MKEFDTNFYCYKYAIGRSDSIATMNVNESTATSSLFNSSSYLKENFSVASTLNTIEVPVKKLDSLDLLLEGPVLLKIDVQGYEQEVLLGAVNTLKNIDTILVELSFAELYEKQPLFEDIYALLKSNGFVYAGNYDQINSPINGLVLQADGIFFKQ